ncbi:MAG: hypothetical protein ACTHMS_14290 [Jatrophihabitans sp.]|uniref:hypothetical protein n=1 Tax=Jatrophihabitans sp. TaxID=1932789 RepID=UPI003F7E483E
MSETDLEPTRRALHAVAEHLLAGPQYRASGRIRLAVTADGFATVADPAVRLAGAEVSAGDRTCPVAGTVRRLGFALGLEPGRPEGLYEDGSGVGLDDTLTVDPDAAGIVLAALITGDAALREFAPDETPVLWPEHFDVAIRIDEVNYGVSPGDGFVPEPYAYVGVHPVPPGGFWNAPFGAARPLRELGRAADVAAFFAEGRAASAG